MTFTSTLGTLEPQEAVTSNGQAVVTLQAGTQSGTASIVAFSGSARTETPITVLIGGAAAASVEVSANPAIVASSGGTVTITASVSDADGNRLAGVPVSFSTTAGTLGATQAVTDATGVAITTLTTGAAATVTATVTGTTSDSVAIAVSSAPTIALSTTGAGTPTVGTATVFSVTTTAPGSPISSVTIDFGDGTSLSLGSLTGTSSVSHVYTAAGTYSVVATVTDSSGERVTTSTVITVVAQTPLSVTGAASTATPALNAPVTFTATTTAGINIQSYSWSFGDGSTASTTGNATAHAFTTPGIKTISVTATATDGRTGSAQTQVNVQPATGATAAFTFSPTAGTIATSFIFNAGTSTPSTGGSIVRYDWNFGEGTATEQCPGDSACSSNGRSISHSFAAAGTYTVTLTIIDSNGASASTSKTVTVS